MKRISFLAASLALSLGHAIGHEVWIEDSPEGQLVVRFAEYGEDFEKSPGTLDSLGQPSAFSVGEDGKPKTSAADKKADHFALAATTAKSSTHIETRASSPTVSGAEKPTIRSATTTHSPGVFRRNPNNHTSNIDLKLHDHNCRTFFSNP